MVNYPVEVRKVTVYEAKTKLSRLLAAVEDGEEIVICRGKIPIARLIGLGKGAGRRTVGSARGQVVIAADFDAPLSDFDEYR